MVRTLRALVIAVAVALSLLGSASVASADPIPDKVNVTVDPTSADPTSPLPIQFFDITWE